MYFEPAFIVAIVIGLVIGVGIYSLFLINLQNLLKQCNSQNRLIPAGNVWLLLIPFFSIVYQFILYPKISESVEKEFSSRGTRVPGDYGRNLGLAISILSVAGLLQYAGIPLIGNITGLAGFILFIIYWVKTAELKNKLITMPNGIVGISNRTDILD